MIPKLREYLRDLTIKEIEDFQTTYKNHVKATRDGFLNTMVKERLLHFTNWESEKTEREIYDFFYEIRVRARSAIFDMQLLCDVLNENQLQSIFGVKRHKPQAEDLYPISELLIAITSEKFVKGSSKKKEQIKKEREWRKLMLEDVTARGLFKNAIIIRFKYKYRL